MPRKTYIIENLGCANCAAKMEEKKAKLPQVQEATLTFATRQLRVTAEDPDGLLPVLQKIGGGIEPCRRMLGGRIEQDKTAEASLARTIQPSHAIEG